MLTEKVLGLYFLKYKNVKSENYRNKLIRYAFPHFVPLREDYILYQDGAPEHYYSRVRHYLENKRPGK